MEMVFRPANSPGRCILAATMRTFPRLVFFLSCCSLLPSQTNLATVYGVITDPKVSTVPNAEVRARSDETGAVRTARTGSSGQFEISGLPPGKYAIEVQ